MGLLVIVGTEKGAFLARADLGRREWTIDGPLFKGWKVTAAFRDARGRYFLGVTSAVYGATVQISNDLQRWRQAPAGPSYPQGGERRLRQIWRLHAAGPALFAGVDEAGLFRSDDEGETWGPVPGLNDHPTRAAWRPGAGGLCAHAIVTDPARPERMWCGISAVGVFRTDDGGLTWHPKNQGVPVIIEDKVHKDIGYCVHALAQDPHAPATIFRQDHRGMFRTRDGGERWERIEQGLPSGFGFPLVIDPTAGALFAVPLESDEYRMPPEGRLRVYRSRNGGDSWEPLTRGLPQAHVYAAVLRGALAGDGLDPGGIYVGTTAGTLYASRDSGDTWEALPATLPRILCVAAMVE